MRWILTFLFILSSRFFFAQEGCTDPQALNYDENATVNDGSCLYPPTEFALTEINLLPDNLRECSGLEYFNSSLWIHNDAGNEDKIYRIDSLSGQILQSVIIATADNLDWEDFAENSDYLFLGDFGNNPGNRTDLSIYRIQKADLASVTVNAEKIEFTYSDQVDFSENHNNHDFDCEAMLFYNDSLHLFTKNWVDNQTRHYVLPNEPGQHIAQLRAPFNVGGLITSADVNDQGEIVLLGYTELGSNFMWLLFDYHGSNFFSGNKRKIALGNGFQNSQTEGIAFKENGYGYICSEAFKVTNDIILPQKLLAFSTHQWTNPITALSPPPSNDRINIYPNPFHQYMEIQNAAGHELNWQLFDAQGVFIRSGSSRNPVFRIQTNELAPGTYILSFFTNHSFTTYKLSKL